MWLVNYAIIRQALMFFQTVLSISVVVILSTSVGFATAQEPTLEERVEASGGKPLTISVLREVFPVPIATLAAHSDLVVTGRLVRVRSYLAPNKKEIFTDFSIQPNQVLLERSKDVRSTSGQRSAMVLTVFGGQITLNGTQVTMVDETMKPINDQGEFLVFVTHVQSQPNNFQLAEGSAGLFELIAGQRVEPLYKRRDKDPDVHGVPFAELVSRIKATAARK